jgi:N6-adenosine-specific RNA methylase IME4
MQIEKYSGFSADLAVAETLQEIKLLESKAAAAAEFARKNKVGIEEQNQWGKFRVEIESKKGEWLDREFPAGGARNFKVSPIDLEIMPVTKTESSNARKVFRNPELANEVMKVIESRGDIITPNKVASEVKKIERAVIIEAQRKDIEANCINSTTGLYDVISIDPPWPYGRTYDPETSRVANPYPEMSIEEIKEIKLPFSDNSVIFLWTTHAFLPDAFDILNHYGFTYKATLVWNKVNMGMGAWFRMQCEFCLFAVKGKPLFINTTERDIIIEARREHSRKPDLFFEMVGKTCNGRKLEYFSREQRPGWDTYGNDTLKF